MKTYTIYAPPEDNRPLDERAIEYKFLREGFAPYAAIFGPLWLVAKQLWLEALAYFMALLLLIGLLQWFGLNEFGSTLLYFLISSIFALFAGDIERQNLERQGYKMVSVVNGKSLGECEASYFKNLAAGAIH